MHGRQDKAQYRGQAKVFLLACVKIPERKQQSYPENSEASAIGSGQETKVQLLMQNKVEDSDKGCQFVVLEQSRDKSVE
jgi:hypothetical protein